MSSNDKKVLADHATAALFGSTYSPFQNVRPKRGQWVRQVLRKSPPDQIRESNNCWLEVRICSSFIHSGLDEKRFSAVSKSMPNCGAVKKLMPLLGSRG